MIGLETKSDENKQNEVRDHLTRWRKELLTIVSEIERDADSEGEKQLGNASKVGAKRSEDEER